MRSQLGQLTTTERGKKPRIFYLDVFGKLIIGEDTERGEVADRVELEDDLDGLTVARVVTPSDPTFTADRKTEREGKTKMKTGNSKASKLVLDALSLPRSWS